MLTDGPEPCPGEDAFIALLERGLDPDARRVLDGHIDRCAVCSRLVADLAELATSAEVSRSGARAVRPGDAATEPGRQVFGGRYTIMRLVGRGGMGAVYEAFDESLGRKVAIKVLRADLIDPERRVEQSARLLREARMLAAVHHPNVLSVYDVGTFEDQVYMAVQYVEGTTLREWSRDETPGWRAVLEVYLKAGDGLAEAHKQGLVHRDIKPDNILIATSGRVWLADFGLAFAIGTNVVMSAAEDDRLADDEDALLGSVITRTGAVLGTPAYMAPEQHLAQDADERSDQFSFAAALFESLYGTRAHEGRTRHALQVAVCEGQLKPRPAGPVPRSVYAVLRRALSPRPAARFDSLSMFLTALRRAVAHQPLWRRALSLVAGVNLASVVVVGLLSTALVVWITDRLDKDRVVVTARLPPIDAAAGLGATDDARPDATPAPLTPEQRRALELDALRAENRACAEHEAGCQTLLDHLARCCLDTDIEGIAHNNEARFRAGAAGLADRFLAMCDAGNAGACVASAFAYVFGVHDVSMAEQELVPRFVETMRKGCLRGAAIGCAVIQDTYADGDYSQEGTFSIAPSNQTLVAILGESCEAGFGRACWFLAESQLGSGRFPHNARLDRAALIWAANGCERGWALACLVGGLAHRDLDPDACALDMRPLIGKLPANDVFDNFATWADVRTFCTRFRPAREHALARTLLERGCNTRPDGEDAAARAVQTVSITLCCAQLRSLEAAVQRGADTP